MNTIKADNLYKIIPELKSAYSYDEVGNKIIAIFQDEEPENPREDYTESCLGIMFYSSRSYTLGDVNLCNSLKSMDDYVADEICIKLPVYAYIHGGVTIDTKPIMNPHMGFDSGQCGEIFTTKAKIRQWFGVKRITSFTREKALKQLQAEVNTFNQYLSGGVYGFKTFDKASGDEIDSCWGIYDSPTKIVQSVVNGEY